MFGKPWISWTCAAALLVLAAGLSGFAQDDRGIAGTAAAGIPTAERRCALVIGNSAYPDGRLRNPVNDAKAVASALRQCGFDVIEKTDCDKRKMTEALAEFAGRTPAGGVAMFFYAGHGIQVEGENYLVPLGADLNGPGDVEFECVNAERVLRKMEESRPQLNIMVLDACRNNPWTRSWKREVPSGLAAMEAPGGTIIAYATAKGQTADDGPGENGLYTSQFLKYVQTPGLNAVEVFLSTAADVKRVSGKDQEPWLSLSYTGKFYFVPGTPPTATAVASVPAAPPPAPAALALTGHLQVNVNAPEAKVIIDGKSAGKATLKEALNILNLPVGKTPVRVEAEGYEPLEKIVEIPENAWAQEKFVLAKVILVKPEEKRPPTEITPSSPPSTPPSDGAKAGQTKTVDLGGGVSLEMVWIPPGTFTMGTSSSEKSHQDDA